MRNSKLKTAIAGAAICLGVTPALAFHGPSPEDMAQIDAIRTEVFAEADADGDGALSETEFASFHELMRTRLDALHFAKLDTDSSGGVTLTELEAGDKMFGGPPPR